MGGCIVGRDTKKALLEAGEWEKVEIGIEKENWMLFPHAWGRLVKAGPKA